MAATMLLAYLFISFVSSSFQQRVLVKSFAEKLACIARTILEWYFLHPASRVAAALDVAAVRASFLAQEETELLPSKEIEVSSISCAALIHKTTCFGR
jgi:hypothetical protein